MKCKKCGEKIERKALICYNCGAVVETKTGMLKKKDLSKFKEI
jgi:hypothetical protein